MSTEKVKPPVVLSSPNSRIAAGSVAKAAAQTFAGDSNAKTPDYHLEETGNEVQELLHKIKNLDPNKIGGVIILESSSGSPANADTVLNAGSYVASYMTSTGFPAEFQNATPIRLDVDVKQGVTYQTIECMGNKYQRWSNDGGTAWSQWATKSTNSGTVDTSDPETPPEKDPVTVIQENITVIQGDITELQETVNNLSAGSITLGTEEEGEQILAGTFDYDAQPVLKMLGHQDKEIESE